jgi:hypothetical protein
MTQCTEYYIIFKQGGGFYRPNACGYTTNLSEAGRFTHEDAISYAYPNGKLGPRDGISLKLESEYLDISTDVSCEKDIEIGSLKIERDSLLVAKDQLNSALTKALVEIKNLKIEISAEKWVSDTLSKLL